jgi:hypothetical protein
MYRNKILLYNSYIMKRLKNGSTPKQYAYAMRRWGGEGKSRRQIALAVGYAENTANNVVARVEKTEGFHNALGDLAEKNHALALKVYAELNKRDLSGEDFTKLINSIQIIGNAFEKFAPKQAQSQTTLPYKALLLQHVENQTIQATQNKNNVKDSAQE